MGIIFQIIACEQRTNKRWELTEEGKMVLEKGSHEAQVYNAVPENGIVQSELMVSRFRSLIFCSLNEWAKYKTQISFL